ncbi:hypothetical protein RFI_39407 [Reticulomyxa filosa]|uniref:Uncharacterized protein n=1 Tax=Reticulomyxa filosa TaxID=46433 RepID=X6L9R7_RETFI|nr:hypothetical protein RFI_39407 [Reticulomyxa filosa]|eukprot:ETN98110.1 hypothetical protein RFI_39407 [Reticulomyxa filosa]
MKQSSFTSNIGPSIIDIKRSSGSISNIYSLQVCIDNSVESEDMIGGDLITMNYSNVSINTLEYGVYIEMDDNSFIGKTITALLTNNWFKNVMWKQQASYGNVKLQFNVTQSNSNDWRDWYSYNQNTCNHL